MDVPGKGWLPGGDKYATFFLAYLDGPPPPGLPWSEGERPVEIVDLAAGRHRVGFLSEVGLAMRKLTTI